MTDKDHDIVSKLVLNVIQMRVHVVDDSSWRHVCFELFLVSQDLIASYDCSIYVGNHDLFLACLLQATSVDELLYVRHSHEILLKSLIEVP